MTEQTAKKILFNKSTLLSLKAELLKKQEEVKEKKLLPQHKVECFKPPRSSEQKDSKSDEGNRNKFKEKLIAIDTEELEACRKSKSALEKKAELYNHLADGAGNSQLASRFLVDFKEKKNQEPPVPEKSNIQEYTRINDSEEDGDWIEFTDCLGRTRKCIKSDLEFYKKRDSELMKLMKKEPEEPKETVPEKPFLVQKTNDYLQSLREKWEEKEREMLAKDKDIHYQDLLFDEARIHGVGYYAFSTDETERRKQMSELLEQRQQTLQAQKEAEEARVKRDELIAARVAAARARQRARAGLPPEDPNENQKDYTTCLLEFLNQKKNEADNKAKEEEKKLKEEQEKERQKLRDAYVREWDIGKEGIDDKVKKFREMTQEEYVEQQRSKRIKEFGPVHGSNSSDSKCTFDSDGRIIGSDDSSVARSSSDVSFCYNKNVLNSKDDSKVAKNWADVRPAAKTPPPPLIDDIAEIEPQKGLYFTTKKADKVVKYRNFVRQQEPTPIVNELSDEDNDNEQSKGEKRGLSDHTEIAPPPTYEYYGPVPKQRRVEKPFNSDIQEAFAQGTKSLEPKSGNRQLSKNYDFTFD